jgi:RNA polymerase sigma-70 factor (ECF subfamily)
MQTLEWNAGVAGGDEISLVQAAKGGDVAAFETLVRLYDQKVFRIARHITQNHEDAEDVAQEVFLKAFRGLARFQGKSRFSTWLYRIAVNESLMKLRQRRRIHVVPVDEGRPREPAAVPLEIVDWGPNPEQLYRQSELKEILAKALQKLSPMYRTVFLLRDVEGFSTDETAEVLELNVSAVKARLFRARLKLSARLADYFAISAVKLAHRIERKQRIT